MKIEELNQLFENGEIDVKKYAMRMFENYEELFAYKALIKKSKVSEIIINESEILFKMTIHPTLHHKDDYEIIMELYKEDYAAVPNTVLSLGDYEPLELDMISRIVDYMPEGTFFDVGANLGWYAINIKKQFPNMQVYTFEPISETFHKMVKNIQLNKLKGIYSNNFGLYDKNTTLEFYYDIEASGASSLKNLSTLGNS